MSSRPTLNVPPMSAADKVPSAVSQVARSVVLTSFTLDRVAPMSLYFTVSLVAVWVNVPLVTVALSNRERALAAVGVVIVVPL